MESRLLLNLGYNGNISEQDFKEVQPNSNFIQVVVWLSSELVKFCELESFISHNIDAADSLSFLVEVSSLLKELRCPYKSLTKGKITERITYYENKKLLITYLCTELQAVKIQAFRISKIKNTHEKIEIDESKTAKELKTMLICLQLSKPPEIVTIQQIFEVLEKKLKLLSQPLTPSEKLGEFLFTGCLTEKQWFQMEYLYQEMYKEYKTRRHLLLTRLDVTIKSFLWSDTLKTKSEEIMIIYEKSKNGILLEPMVKISDILAAKPELAFIEKTSSASVRKNTKCSINELIIGAVPDRGGRPKEQKPPPPEIPSWPKNKLSEERISKFSKKPSFSSNPSYSRGNTECNNISRCGKKDYPNSQTINCYFSKEGSIAKDSQNIRNNYNKTYATPMYQVNNNRIQMGNPPFQFGGYMPAGDNFHQYGTGNGQDQVNQRNNYQRRVEYYGPRQQYKDGHLSRHSKTGKADLNKFVQKYH